MKLTFYSEFSGEKVHISNPKTWEELQNDIKEYLNKKKYKSYYRRYWFEENKLVVDFGSHSEFFHVTDATEDDLKPIKLSK